METEPLNGLGPLTSLHGVLEVCSKPFPSHPASLHYASPPFAYTPTTRLNLIFMIYLSKSEEKGRAIEFFKNMRTRPAPSSLDEQAGRLPAYHLTDEAGLTSG